jgi:8-oxo-dGTP pyrophosphatase MutT (NUDIX family)
MSQAAPSAAPVTPRPAASLLLLRHGAAGPELLMGLRGAGHRFMPNRLVFPGGGVDPEDFSAPVATPPRPHVRGILGAEAGADLADAIAAASARELLEETGLSLGDPPRLDGLSYLCRAITPAASPVRFDARFFVVPADSATGTLAGSGELEGLRYYPAQEALALDLANATRLVLGKLLEFLAIAPDRRDTDWSPPLLVERVWHTVGNLCPPCDPVVGTVAYRLDRVPPAKPHHPFTGDHVHLYTMHQNPHNRRCFWRPSGVMSPPPPAGAMRI